MPRPDLENGSCGELAPQVVDNFFHASLNDLPRDIYRLRTNAAKNICARCVVLDDCRSQAIGSSLKRESGVVAGATTSEVERARAWQRFELGLRETPPEGSRPEWLPRSEAAETYEQTLVEVDDGVER